LIVKFTGSSFSHKRVEAPKIGYKCHLTFDVHFRCASLLLSGEVSRTVDAGVIGDCFGDRALLGIEV